MDDDANAAVDGGVAVENEVIRACIFPPALADTEPSDLIVGAAAEEEDEMAALAWPMEPKVADEHGDG